jgi:hypothetical protein
MAWIEPATLRSNGLTLEPLTHAHHDDRVEAVGENDARRQSRRRCLRRASRSDRYALTLKKRFK